MEIPQPSPAFVDLPSQLQPRSSDLFGAITAGLALQQGSVSTTLAEQLSYASHSNLYSLVVCCECRKTNEGP